MDSNLSAYLRTWSDEFQARADRVRLLIGSAHWLTDGHHKETLLRDFLRRYLPSTIEVSRGFIRTGSEGALVSPELDILITDPHRQPAFLSEFGLTISSPAAVRGHIEVKSSFNQTTLRDALKNIADARGLLNDSLESINSWSCAFFYNVRGSTKPERILNQFQTPISSTILSQTKRRSVTAQQACTLLPSCVVALGHFIAFLDSPNGTPRVRLFATHELSASLAILDLFAFLQVETAPGMRTDFDDLIAGIGCAAPYTKEFVSE